jgi:Family of unknown function (DUF6350)
VLVGRAAVLGTPGRRRPASGMAARLLFSDRAGEIGVIMDVCRGAPPPAWRKELPGLVLVTTSALGARLAGPGQGSAEGGLSPDQARPLVVTGAIAACSAAGVGLAVLTILVLVGWIAAPHPGLGLTGVLRTAAVLWLVGHHVGVQVSGAGRIGMLPLGLVLLPGALLWRAGRWVVRRHAIVTPVAALAAALAVAVPYTLLAGALAAVSRTALAAPSVPQGVVAGFVVAAVAAGFGATRALAPWAQLGGLLSARTRSVLAGTAGSLALLGAMGALLTALTLASHVREFGSANGLLAPGVIGAGLLFLAELAYLPNAVLWAIAYLLGPGFAVGTGTIVAPTGSAVGPLPAFPLLAALPHGPHGSAPAWLTVLVLAGPYVAGAVGGLLVVRIAPTPALEAAPVRGFCCGALTGAVLGVLAAFAGGPLGDGRMAAVGPSAWQVAVVAALEVGVAAAVTAGAANWRYVMANGAGGRITDSESDPGRRASWPSRRSGMVPRRPDEDSRDVIYLDRWAGDQEEDPPSGRSRGPSVLP